MEDIPMVVVSALVGAVVAALGAAIQSLLSAREKVDESLRAARLAHYGVLWDKTRLLPKWPYDDKVTYADLAGLSNALREWYFDGGGIVLSARARKIYGKAQDSIGTLLDRRGWDSPAALDRGDYETVRRALSRLRTELTRDLQSRKRAFLVLR